MRSSFFFAKALHTCFHKKKDSASLSSPPLAMLQEKMTKRFYDVLEDTKRELQQWRTDEGMQKADVLDSMDQRVLTLLGMVISAPMVGTLFAYPGDLDLSEWTAPTSR